MILVGKIYKRLGNKVCPGGADLRRGNRLRLAPLSTTERLALQSKC